MRIANRQLPAKLPDNVSRTNSSMPNTESDRVIFKQRFREPVEILIEKEHTGFALMMIAMPLIERLLRGRCKIGDQMKLPSEF